MEELDKKHKRKVDNFNKALVEMGFNDIQHFIEKDCVEYTLTHKDKIIIISYAYQEDRVFYKILLKKDKEYLFIEANDIRLQVFLPYLTNYIKC